MNDDTARAAPERGSPQRACPRCGGHLRCGAGTGHCWCASLPPLRALPAGLGAQCLCERCLSGLLAHEAPARGVDRTPTGSQTGC